MQTHNSYSSPEKCNRRTPQKIIKKTPPPPQLKLCCGSFPFFVYL